MKHTRRFLALLLTLVLTLGLCVTAFAEGDETEAGGTATALTGSITISRVDENHKNPITYKLYRIFTIESLDTTTGVYSYKIADDWADFFDTDKGGAGASYVEKLDNGYVTWHGDNANDTDYVKGFAEKAIAYAKDLTPVANGTIGEDKTSITISDLPLGYYLIDSTLGSLCALTPTATAANVTEKNEYPTVKKEAKNSTDFGKTNQGAVGDDVTFQITVEVKKGEEQYVVHDTMAAGLKLNADSITVAKKVNGQEPAEAMTVNTDYTLTTVVGNTDDDQSSFVLKLEDASISAGDKVIITYSGKITAAAVKTEDGVVNEAYLEYGDDNETTHETTKTYTWELDIFKFTQKGENETPLAGAEFVLYKEVAGEEGAKLKKYASFTDDVFSGWKDTKEEATKLTSGKDGKINVKGLGDGTYYLEETAAPAGYNKLKEPVTVTIASEETDGARTHTVNGTTVTANNNAAVKVENKTGAVLPSTGGIGTTVFYVVGSVMALGAVILLVTKRRMAA